MDFFYPPDYAKADEINTELERKAKELYDIVDYVRDNFNYADYWKWTNEIKENL